MGVPDSIMDQWSTYRHSLVIQGHRKTDGWMDGWKDPLISIQGHILEGRIYGSQLQDKQMDQWTKGPTDRQTHRPTLL